MAITISANAQERITHFLNKRGKGIGLRIGVKTTGCSGLAYKLEFVDFKKDNDLEFIVNNIMILIDEQSLPFLNGIELDYVKNGLQEGFNFTNPNAKGICGCGESFTV